MRERATNHGITLEVKVDERLGDIVGDERKIKQILLNLLSNAVKFTPEGGRITINARPTNGSVEISVTDTGIGIAEEDQPKIFEEFRQVGSDNAQKDRRHRTGINAWRRSSSSCMAAGSGSRVKWAKAAPLFLHCRSTRRKRWQDKSRKIRSTNFEIRNKFKMMKTNAMFQTNSNRMRGFGISGFGIYLAAVCFEFRASDFGFSF